MEWDYGITGADDLQLIKNNPKTSMVVFIVRDDIYWIISVCLIFIIYDFNQSLQKPFEADVSTPHITGL